MTRDWAIVQVDAGTSVEANLEAALGALAEAARAGCSTVAFPEFFLLRGRPATLCREAFGPDGEIIRRLCQGAREHEVNVLGGTIPVPADSREETIVNTALAISAEGELVSTYRKLHLFDVEIDGELAVHESEYQAAGERTVVTELDDVPTGMSICYDLRFPELYRRLIRRGARVLFVPSNFTRETGRAHWEPLLRARAIENQAWVVAPNQIGTNPETDVASLGQSLVVDPWGQVVCRASDRTGWWSTRIDFDYQNTVRERLPALDHVRLLTSRD